jgi:hypothetical protein
MYGIVDVVYSKARRVRSLLGFKTGIDAFAAETVNEKERDKSDLHRLFYGNDGPVVHKWQHYLLVYDRYLSQYRNRPVRLLEIGVFKGGSMHLWRKYFGPEAILFGIDIDPKCAQFDGRDAQIRIGSQGDPDFLRQVVEEMGDLDVVIDDGSHVCSHQEISFNNLFPKMSPEGVYICEDMHTNYWHGWQEGGYRRHSTFIEKTKRIVDDMHADFHNRGEHEVAKASRTVLGVHYYNSMVVIEKSPQERPSHIQIGTS